VQRILDQPLNVLPKLVLTALLWTPFESLPGQTALPPETPDFTSFVEQYPLKPIEDYTFLGTEESREKPIVLWNGRIEQWFDPAERVPWIADAAKKGAYDVALVDGYLPAIRFNYKKPGSIEVCEMTVFASDASEQGKVHVYVRLVEKAAGKDNVTHCLRLPESAPSDEAAFEAALKKLRQHWAECFRRGIDLPCVEPQLLNAAKASLVRALITFTGKHPHCGVRGYGQSIHDGFPPTIIALTHTLLEWGQTQKALEYLAAYFERFVTREGRFDYYGPSLAEYGQMLHLVRRIDEVSGHSQKLSAVRAKAATIREWLWTELENSTSGLLSGVPEADTRKEIDIYFHNNAWCWRGLSDISKVLKTQDEERCEKFRKTILKAIDQVTDKNVDPPFVPPVFRQIKPLAEMTQDDFASYTNYRYWLELLSSGILLRTQAEALIKYRISHGGEVAGMTRFRKHADNWPLAELGLARLALGDLEALREILYSHLAGHTSRATWTAYEQVSISGERRKAIADYCVPSQLVVPRLLAAWSKASCGFSTLKVPALSGKVEVDGVLDEFCYRSSPSIEDFVVAGQPDQRPARTQAWLFWQPEGLIFAFKCKDDEILAAALSAREHDVDSQDRVELFLWSGNPKDAYLCLEIGAHGAVHDYKGKFYRQFDDEWSPESGWEHATKIVPGGYQVEAVIPRSALEAFGFKLEPGTRWRAGFFRADFTSGRSADDPFWITWVDANGREPDFHVQTSFGGIVLGEPR
jgi:hypothetical protein